MIEYLEKRYNDDKSESGDIGVDGDGFHYSTINVPDGSTGESLGVFLLTYDNYIENEDNI